MPGLFIVIPVTDIMIVYRLNRKHLPFHRLLVACGIQRVRFRRTHHSFLRARTRRRLQSGEIYQIFIRGATKKTIPICESSVISLLYYIVLNLSVLVVSPESTAGEIMERLRRKHRDLIPSTWRDTLRLFRGTGGPLDWQVQLWEHDVQFNAHLELRTRVLGGAGTH